MSKKNAPTEPLKTRRDQEVKALVEDWSQSLPEGVVVHQTGEERTYFVAKSGNILQGRLMSVQTIERVDAESGEVKSQRLFGVLVDRPCKVVLAKAETDADGSPYEYDAEPGSMVYVSERSQLDILTKLSALPIICWVSVQPTKKVKIGNGRSVWNFSVAYKPLMNERRVSLEDSISMLAAQAESAIEDDRPALGSGTVRALPSGEAQAQPAPNGASTAS